MLTVLFFAGQGVSSGVDPLVVVGVALIAGTTAVIGAIIAAVTAGKRQKEQLSHDTEHQRVALDAEQVRLNGTLAAEQERLAARLSHERDLADQADMRAVLEDASIAQHVCVQRAGAVRDAIRAAAPPEQAFADLDSAIREMWAHENRLAVRLGPDDPVFDAYKRGAMKLQDAREFLRTVAAERTSTDLLDEATRAKNDAILIQEEFWKAATRHRAAAAPDGGATP